jgi:hypothetical protein
MEGEVRASDRVELCVAYATSVNQVRQENQQVVKAGWEPIGIRV